MTLRHDMRNATGGVLLAVLGIASPEGGAMSDLEAVPNPVIHSCQILDPGRDVRRIEVVSEVLRRGRQMSYSRSRIVDADDPGRVLALTEGQGVIIGAPPEGLQKMDTGVIHVVDSPDLPPLWQVFGAHRRDDGHGHCRNSPRAGLARCRAAYRPAVRRPRDGCARPRRRVSPAPTSSRGSRRT